MRIQHVGRPYFPIVTPEMINTPTPPPPPLSAPLPHPSCILGLGNKKTPTCGQTRGSVEYSHMVCWSNGLSERINPSAWISLTLSSPSFKPSMMCIRDKQGHTRLWWRLRHHLFQPKSTQEHLYSFLIMEYLYIKTYLHGPCASHYLK